MWLFFVQSVNVVPQCFSEREGERAFANARRTRWYDENDARPVNLNEDEEEKPQSAIKLRD